MTTRRAHARIALLLLPALVAAAPADRPIEPSHFVELRWRLVGPFRGGRVLAVTGVPGHPNTFYFGAVGGGVWKTENAGRTWVPIFDEQPIASIGAIAVAPSDARVVYVGSGEADMRSDISYGNGMYRSSDAGRTWKRIGLADTRQIGRILVDPSDAHLVYVAALGHAYGPNPERGVFRSRDGGEHWTRVLHRDDDTGAIDLAMDPRNSRTILAALWQTRRPPWNTYPPSNGAGSGLYRSDDGGDTWRPIVGSGLPSEKLGRIGLAFAPSDARRVYALVDAKEGGLYASEDGGTSWKRASADPRIWERGWYFGGITVDPKNADVVYACDTAMYRSTDGGKTFAPIKGAPGGDDYHQLWIDPQEPRRMILASDQGAVVSVDGAKTWSSWYNQPTAQLYHVATDDRFPYWIYGAQQDSGAVATPSETDYRTITLRDWRPIAAGGENGYIAADPTNPDVVYGGSVGRFDHRTLQDQDVDPTMAYPGSYRHTWTLPLVFSPRDPRSLYFANQFLFRTKDGGKHWDRLSPDLSREDPGVPPNLDVATAADSPVRDARRGVIYAIAPSPVTDGWIWCGTDDGLVWLTKDEGKHWENVTPRGLSAWSKVGVVEASRFDAATAYAAVDRHRLEDLSAHVYRTRDAGRTWTEVSRGIPDGSYVNVVREDSERRGLLYAGTETGVFVSFDDGDRWLPLQGNLPNCSVRDIAVRRGDLVIATHGRSFWVMDDVSPLRQLDSKVLASAAWLLAPRPAVRRHPAGFQGTPEPKDEPGGENPPSGAILSYWLKAAAATPVVLEIVNERGELIRRYSSDEKPKPPDPAKIQITADWVPQPEPPPASAGMHRFVWDLRYAAPPSLSSATLFTNAALWAPPGRYTARLTVGGETRSQPLIVARDPRIAASDGDLAAQFELARRIQSERERVAAALERVRMVRERIASASGDARGETSALLEELSKKLDRVAGPAGPPTYEDFSTIEEEGGPTLRRVSFSLLRLQLTVESADAAPTPDATAAFRERTETAEKVLAAWEQFEKTELPAAHERLKKAGSASGR